MQSPSFWELPSINPSHFLASSNTLVDHQSPLVQLYFFPTKPAAAAAAKSRHSCQCARPRPWSPGLEPSTLPSQGLALLPAAARDEAGAAVQGLYFQRKSHPEVLGEGDTGSVGVGRT